MTRATSSRRRPVALDDRAAAGRRRGAREPSEVDGGRQQRAPRCAARAWPARRAAWCARRRTRPRRRRRRCRGRTAGRRPRCALSARSTAVPALGPSGTTVMPSDCRSSTNHSNSSGGSSGSTTTVIGWPCVASHAPAHSQPPRWGSAMMAPLPAASAASRCSEPLVREAGVELAPARRSRQPERLDPVAGVGLEGSPHRAVERARRSRLPAVDPAQVALDHRAPAPHAPGQHGARSPRAPTRRPVRAGTRLPPRRRGSRDREHGRARPRRGQRPGRGRRRRRQVRCSLPRCCAAAAPRQRSRRGRHGWHGQRPGRRSAWRHTLTKRWTAVTTVSTSMTHRTGISSDGEQQADARGR